MIAIYINGERADFFGSLTIKKDNPLLAKFDVEPTEHTYTLTLPATATNVQLFSFAQYTFANPQASARIEVDGVVMLEGSCNVQSWSESGYSVYFSGVTPQDNTTPIKEMLGDKQFISDLLSFGSPQIEHQGFVGEIEHGIIIGIANGYDSVGGTKLIQTNVAFSAERLLSAIADHYGISIEMLAEFTEYYIVCAGLPSVRIENFGGRPIYYLDADKSLPRITAKVLLESIASAFGYKLKIDHVNNTISFFALTEINLRATQLSHTKYQVSFNADVAIVGTMSFTQAKALEVDTDDGKQTFPYTDYESVEISKGTAKYENRLSLMHSESGGIIMPQVREEKAEDEVVALCSVTDDGNYFLTIENYSLPTFTLYEGIADKATAIKFSANLNSLQFTALDMWRAVYLENIGEVFVKSINYKSDSDSDIEGYLI